MIVGQLNAEAEKGNANGVLICLTCLSAMCDYRLSDGFVIGSECVHVYVQSNVPHGFGEAVLAVHRQQLHHGADLVYHNVLCHDAHVDHLPGENLNERRLLYPMHFPIHIQ